MTQTYHGLTEIEYEKVLLYRLAEVGSTEEPEDAQLRRRYSPMSKEGRPLYEHFTDGELLNLLRSRAEILGHAPAQKEMFWVFRAYIKQRFGKWPYALKAAGLSKAAGRGGLSLEEARRQKERVEAAVLEVRAAADALGRVPHPSDLPETHKILKKQFHSWREVLNAAGVDPATLVKKIPEPDETVRLQLSDLRALAETLRRAPLRKEVPPALYAALVKRCGSWRNSLYQIDLTPVVQLASFSSSKLAPWEKPAHSSHITALEHCCYKLLWLEPDEEKMLELIRKRADELGRAPEREEVPEEARGLLIGSCGSWRNVLFQLDLQPSEHGGSEKTS